MTFSSRDLKYLVDTHGKTLTYTVKGDPVYDPTTGEATSSDTDYTIKGYFYNYNLSDVNGATVLAGDRRLVMNLVDTSGVTIPEPEDGYQISGEGDTVEIISVAKIMSGPSAVCYICQVRE